MTDRDALFAYRLSQAEETLAEVERLIGENFSSRTVINRAYYVLFYALLALFLKTGTNVQTSKHSGIISLFDREFVRTGKFDRRFSRILHNLFDDRQEGDYKEFCEISMDKARQHAIFTREFLDAVTEYTGGVA